MRAVGPGRRGPNPFSSEPLVPVQVAVIDDHLLVGRLIVSLLERAGYTARHVYGDTLEATWANVRRAAPQLILLDFQLGPNQESLALLDLAVAHGVTVAGLTASDDRVEYARYIEAGLSAVISKGSGPADLIAVVEMALAGTELMSADDRHAALSRLRKHRVAESRKLACFELLTDREAETLSRVAAGQGAAEIAEDWDISLTTVRSHIRAILTKLGLKSQLQAAALARDSGWYAIMGGDSASSILTMSDHVETGTIARRSGSRG